eukprot:9162082-Alexandrium_andersonii.AAC.1
MSASLVGSEMCIRDSKLRWAPARPRPSRRSRCWAAVWSPRARGRVRAVSYTHLTLPTICSV